MKNIEIKKLFINGFLASALCINMTACDKADVEDEKEITTSTSINYVCPDGYISEGKMCRKITVSDVMNKVDKFNKYIETQTINIENHINEDFDNYDSSNTLSYIYLLNKDFISDEVTNQLYEYGLPKDMEELKTQYNNVIMHIAYVNGFYSFNSYLNQVDTKDTNYISISDFILSDKYKMDIYELDRQLYNESGYAINNRANAYRESGKTCNYKIKNNDSVTEHTIYMTYSYSNLVHYLTELDTKETQKIENDYNEQINYVINELVNKDYSKTKVLTK